MTMKYFFKVQNCQRAGGVNQEISPKTGGDSLKGSEATQTRATADWWRSAGGRQLDTNTVVKSNIEGGWRETSNAGKDEIHLTHIHNGYKVEPTYFLFFCRPPPSPRPTIHRSWFQYKFAVLLSEACTCRSPGGGRCSAVCSYPLLMCKIYPAFGFADSCRSWADTLQPKSHQYSYFLMDCRTTQSRFSENTHFDSLLMLHQPKEFLPQVVSLAVVGSHHADVFWVSLKCWFFTQVGRTLQDSVNSVILPSSYGFIFELKMFFDHLGDFMRAFLLEEKSGRKIQIGSISKLE